MPAKNETSSSFLFKLKVNTVISKMAVVALKKINHKARTNADEFITQALAKYGDRFTYEKVIYLNRSVPVTITCNFHGDFDRPPCEFLRNRCTCPYCRERLCNDQRKPQRWVVENVWGNRYTYDNFIYIGLSRLTDAQKVELAADPEAMAERKAREKKANTSQQVSIYCTAHDVNFMQACNKHVHGIVGCPQCLVEWRRAGKTKDHNSFLKNSFPDLFAKLWFPEEHDATVFYSKDYTSWKCLDDPTHVIDECPLYAIMNGLNCVQCIGNLPLSQFHKIYNEWNDDLNVDIDKDMVLASNTSLVHWICKKNPKHHHYTRTIADRCIDTKGCRVCNKKDIDESNRLDLYIPKLVNEWHPDNEKPISEYSYGSKSSVKWICSKQHVWNAMIHCRAISETQCPVCSGRGFSKTAIEWINMLKITCKIQDNIQHAESGGEHTIRGTCKKADGYCQATETIYEYHGDYWHGNPKKYDPNTVRAIGNITFGELYQNTLAREQLILNKGYNLVTIWQMDYNRYLADVKQDASVKLISYCTVTKGNQSLIVPDINPMCLAAAPASAKKAATRRKKQPELTGSF